MEERYYRIGELAKLSGLPVSTIRLWQQRGFLGGSRSHGGHRLFGDRDLRWVLQARDLTQGRYMTDELAATVSALVESSDEQLRLGEPVPPRSPRHDPNYERMLDLAAQNARLFAEQRELASRLAEDVAERKAIELSLRASEEKLRLIVENFPDSIFTQDRQLRYTSAVNPAFHPVEEVVGRTVWETLSGEEAELLTRIKQKVMDTGEPARTEVRLSHGDEVRYFDMVISPLRDGSGEIAGVVAYNRDITDRVLREQALRVEVEALKREVGALKRHERLFHEAMSRTEKGVL